MSQCIAMEEKITQFDYEILLDEIYIRRVSLKFFFIPESSIHYLYPIF